jgi:two-component system cell cycle sensor histidine kinase/response regulator CckA
MADASPTPDSNEALNHFAGEIGLRLGKYLMTVLGESNYLLGLHPPGDRSRPWIEQIKSAAGAASQLVQQLITYSCRLPPEMELVSLNSIVRQMAEKFTILFGNSLAKGDFRIDVQLDANDALVMVDAVQLEAAVIRLLKWIHTRIGVGTLTIVTSNHTSAVRLTIKDNGPALSEAEQQKLFDPFNNIDPDTADLGLALTHGVIRQAQGTIQVKSHAQGTEIAIELPLATTEVSMPHAVAKTNKQSVLVVDDEELVRNYLVIALQHLGYEAIPAKDGNEALYQCLQSNINIDVLLTDMILPGMNGRQLAEQAKKVRPTLKLVFMSGYTENLLGEGRVFLRKPVTPDQLEKAMRHVLSTAADTLTKSLSSVDVNLE